MSIHPPPAKHKFTCDICDFPIDISAENLKPFIVKGIDKLFHLHASCRDFVVIAAKHKNFRLLPECRLKHEYFEAMKEQDCRDNGDGN
ncbi:hypothetical protein CMI37_30940 [Candidatus Pacearchaeota archaeon]|nr:hypothetical protein [Candidatus Pacearchaeota archaeon]|tara:strand:- start:2386 stop:2649 length:264 start_codon:yes stop_codon:yes gene_type:complete